MNSETLQPDSKIDSCMARRLTRSPPEETLSTPNNCEAHEIAIFPLNLPSRDITQVVIGQAQRSRWQILLGGSPVQELLRHLKHVDLHVIATDLTDR